MTNWIPTDRVRGGYEPADSAQSKEYSDLSLNNPTVITPGSYANPIGAVAPPTTSIRPAPPQLDPVQLMPSAPPDIPTTGSWTQKSSSSTSTTGKITTTTKKTESSLSFNNGVVDVSVIPYMRRLDVDFHAAGMRPNRKVYFFFDDTDVTDYVSLSNEVTLSDNPAPEISIDPPYVSDLEDDDGTLGDQIIANTSTGWSTSGSPGAGWRRRGFRGTKRMQLRKRKTKNGKVVLQTTGGHDAFGTGSVLRATSKDKKFQVLGNEVKTGRLLPTQWFLSSSNTANAELMRTTIILDPHFRHLPNNYWGTDGSNAVFFLNHQDHPKRTRKKMKIRGWDNTTGYLTVDGVATETVPGFSVNPFISTEDTKYFLNDGGDDIADGIISIKRVDPSLPAYDPIPVDHRGIHKTDETGSIVGTFHVPGATFFTGQKIFRIIDSDSNEVDDDETTTYAEYKFVSQGLHTVVQDVVINSTMTNTTIVRSSDPPKPKKPKLKAPDAKWPTNSCCFIPTAMVTMADSTKKAISDIVVGDKVLSRDDKISTVTDVIITQLGARELYGFTGLEPFATEDHPFLTSKGWTSYKIGAYHDHLVKDNVENICWEPMNERDRVMTPGGLSPVGKISTKSAPEDMSVYALSLDDAADHTYWVEDFLTHNKHDPLAQSFWIDPADYPQGLFVSSVDLFFANKDEVQPVHIEIRPTVNGYPDSNYVVPGSKSTKPAAEVNVSEVPVYNSASSYTKFKFGDPVFLPPGEYAMVIHSKSPEYEVFVSELGEKILGSNSIVSEQPYVGSIFKSQNASTWDASQLQDLMFVINKCAFDPTGRATLYSSSAMQAEFPYGLYPTPVDEMMLHTEQAVLPGTQLSYELASESSNVFSDVLAGTVLIPDTGRIFYPSNAADHTEQEGYFKLAVNMTTENPDISPVIWNERFGAAMYENQIDNAEPTPMDFNIITTGSGYPANSNLALVITGTGSGADAYAMSNSTGHIVDIMLLEPGSGYLSNTSISITANSGSGALITMTSETDPQGGPAWCKYISRTVTLNEGFESADLKTFVTAYKPVGTGIHVYYKVRNNNDPESFAQKPWNKMIQNEYLVEYSRNGRDYLEFEFTPFGEEEAFKSISYTAGGATFNTFNQYAIKIVLTTNDTTIFPVLRDMRAIAMPAVEDL